MTLNFGPPTLLSFLATVVAALVFLIMLQESVALSRGQNPLSNAVRLVARRYPSITLAVAVVIGMVIGHLLWP